MLFFFFLGSLLTFCALVLFQPNHVPVQGDDLHMDLDVELVDALCGFTTTVKGIDGSTVPVCFRSGMRERRGCSSTQSCKN